MAGAFCVGCQSGPPLIPERPIISDPASDDLDAPEPPSTNVGGAGFEVLASWGYGDKEQPSYVAARGDAVYWMDQSRALSVRLRGGASRPMNARVPPESLVEANADGITWVTPGCELWQALVRDLRPRRLWQCSGEPYLFKLDRDAAYIGTRQCHGCSNPAWALWQVDLQGTGARRLRSVPDEVIWSLLPDRDWLYFSAGGIAGRLMRVAKAGGAAQLVASYPMNRILEAVDDTYVYWWDDHGVFRSPKYRGPEMRLMDTYSVPSRSALAMDGSELYWVEPEAGLYAAPLAGGRPRPLATLPDAEDCKPRVEGVAVEVACERGIYRVAKHPGPFPRRARDEWHGIPQTLAVTPTDLYWAERAGKGWSDAAFVGWKKGAAAPSELGRETEIPDSRLVADATHLYYWLRAGTVKRIARSGGAPEIIVDSSRVVPTRPPIPEAALNFSQAFDTVALDAEHVYWIAPRQGAVFRAEKSGGAPQVLADGLDTPVALAVDAGQVYFLTAGTEHFTYENGKLVRDEYHHDGKLQRVPAAGGAVVAMATLPYLPMDLAITDQSIYVSIDASGGDLWRLPKAGGELRPVSALTDNNHVGAIFATSTTLFFSLAPGMVAKVEEGAAPVVLASGLAATDYFGFDGQTLFFAMIPDRYGGRPDFRPPDLVALPVVPERR
jgi:hypothetical protein